MWKREGIQFLQEGPILEKKYTYILDEILSCSKALMLSELIFNEGTMAGGRDFGETEIQ